MYELFQNPRTDNTVCFDDEGILFSDAHTSTFFPYGSMKKIKVGLLGLNVESKDGKVFGVYVPRPEQKSGLKDAVREAEKRNQAAPVCEAQMNYSKESRLFSVDGSLLRLKKRCATLNRQLKMQAAENLTIAYEEEKLHIGAVTVGGVTTGGAYTTGGYNYIAASEKNGKFMLVCGDTVIRRIALTDELVTAVQNSPAAQGLDREAKQIIVIEDVELMEFEREELLHNMKTKGFAGNKYATRGYPDEEKCRTIFNWLTQI